MLSAVPSARVTLQAAGAAAVPAPLGPHDFLLSQVKEAIPAPGVRVMDTGESSHELRVWRVQWPADGTQHLYAVDNLSLTDDLPTAPEYVCPQALAEGDEGWVMLRLEPRCTPPEDDDEDGDRKRDDVLGPYLTNLSELRLGSHNPDDLVRVAAAHLLLGDASERPRVELVCPADEAHALRWATLLHIFTHQYHLSRRVVLALAAAEEPQPEQLAHLVHAVLGREEPQTKGAAHKVHQGFLAWAAGHLEIEVRLARPSAAAGTLWSAEQLAALQKGLCRLSVTAEACGCEGNVCSGKCTH